MLSLRMVDLAGDSGWRWLLTDDDTGAALADHTVALDPAAPELEAFANLYGYLRRNAVPDRRVASEISLVASVGAWIGRDVLGSRVGRTITDAAPVTVHQKQGRLTAFLRDGVSDRNAAQFFDVLVTWTESTLTTLPEHAVLLLRMLRCLEDGDRWSLIVEGNWADVRRRLNHPGDAPDVTTTVDVLTAAALINTEAADGSWVRYRLHPGIAETVHATTEPDIRTAVDTGRLREALAVVGDGISYAPGGVGPVDPALPARSAAADAGGHG
jgi:hypothetical protein